MAVLVATVGRVGPVDADDHRDTTVERFEVLVDGEVARGHLAYPSDRLPTALLVYGHGCCGAPSMARIPERLAFARTHGVAVVAMEYRGAGGWDVAAGAADVIAATVALQRRFPITRTVAWGLSMGAEVTGMAVAARPDLFDWWVGTSGVYDLVEQWAMPGFRTLIERETGGNPSNRAEAYRRRSPVALAGAMRGITGAVLVHGAGDPIALQSQAWRMQRALTRAKVPVRMEMVVLGDRVETPPLPVAGVPTIEAPIALAGHDGPVVAHSARIVGDLLRAGTTPTR